MNIAGPQQSELVGSNFVDAISTKTQRTTEEKLGQAGVVISEGAASTRTEEEGAGLSDRLEMLPGEVL